MGKLLAIWQTKCSRNFVKNATFAIESCVTKLWQILSNLLTLTVTTCHVTHAFHFIFLLKEVCDSIFNKIFIPLQKILNKSYFVEY